MEKYAKNDKGISQQTTSTSIQRNQKTFGLGKLAEYFEKLQKEHETHRKHIDDHKELCDKIAQEFKGKRIHIKKSDYDTPKECHQTYSTSSTKSKTCQ